MNEVCEAFAQKDQVGVTMGPPIYDKQTETVDDDKTVLSDIARSCTQAIDPSYFGKKKNYGGKNELDNPGGSRCDLSEGVYMSHNIMAAFLLFDSSYPELFRSEVLS